MPCRCISGTQPCLSRIARCPVLSWRSRVSPFIAKPVDLFLARVFWTEMEVGTSPALQSSGRAVAMPREALDSADQSIIADYARGRGSIDAPADTIQGLACADKLPSDGRRVRHSISNSPEQTPAGPALTTADHGVGDALLQLTQISVVSIATLCRIGPVEPR